MRTDLLPKTIDGMRDHIIEEMGEAIQAYGKLRRFGPCPKDPKTLLSYDNVRDFEEECTQVITAIARYFTLVRKESMK